MNFKTKYSSKVISPIIEYLKQGASPQKLSLTIVLGFSLGIIPFLGVNTAICFLLSIAFRLNVVVIQLINYIVFPLQIILLVPFFKMGELIFGISGKKLVLNTFSSLFSKQWHESLVLILSANFRALLIWAILMIPLSIIIYFWAKNRLRNWSLIVGKQS